MTKFTNLGYYNGEIGEADELKIPLLDRSNYFGDGVYDATIGRNKVIFALEEHIERFWNSAKGIGIELPFSKKELEDKFYKLLERFKGGDFLLYWQLSRGTALRNHAFPKDSKPNLMILITPFTLPDLKKKIRLITFNDLRFEYCNIKTLNLLPSVLASQAAAEKGAQEAVFVRNSKTVTECAHSNVSILKDGKLKTHPADRFILPGIGRKHLIAKAKELGIPVLEEEFSVQELFDSDEVLVTSSGTFCAGAFEIDGKSVGGKAEETLEKLQDELTKDFLESTKARK